MSENRFAAAPAILVALLVGLPIAAMEVGAAPYVSQAQQAQIQNDYGPGAPYGTWQKLKETQTFYLHSNCDTNTHHAAFANQFRGPADPSVAACPDDQFGGPGATQILWYDTHIPPPASTSMDEISLGLLFGPANFPGAPNFNTATGGCSLVPKVLDDTAVFNFKVNFWATPLDAYQAHIMVEFFHIDAGCNIVGTRPIAAVQARSSGSSSVLFACDPAVGAFCSGSASARLFRGEADVCGQLGGNYYTFVCSPIHGYTIPAGHGIGVRVHADSDDSPFLGPDNGNLQLEFDSSGAAFYAAYNSNFQVVADSARINMWSEDRFGTVTPNFPPGTVNNVQTNPMDRVVRVRAVQASTWGHSCPTGTSTNQLPQNNCNQVTSPPASALPMTCATIGLPCPAHDGIEELSTVLRVRDLTPSHVTPGVHCRFEGDFCYGQFLGLDQTIGLQAPDPGQDQLKLRCCTIVGQPPVYNRPIEVFDPNLNNDAGQGLQRYQVSLPYTPQFLEGTYRIELENERHLWAAGHVFYAGGAGFDFKFHDDEPFVDSTRTIADHRVALGEPTKYSMRLENKGVTTDTYSLAVPTPGGGWTATVSPHQVTLPPRGFANIDVLVTPPSTARGGDIKVVSVTAASPGTNSIQTLFTRTTYTAERLSSVFLTTPTPFLEMRPGLSQVGGIVIHNNGTVKDDYVLTTTGAPPGWTVRLSPSFLPVLAGSREDLTLTVVADAGAPPGSSFTLNVKACKTSDNTICGAVDVAITVFVTHALDVKTLPALTSTCQQAHSPTNVVSLPCSRVEMRDAEKDYVVRSTSPSCQSAGTATYGPNCWVVANKDTHFDDGAIFRILVENKGDTADTIDLSGAWSPPVFHPSSTGFPVIDQPDCDGRNDWGRSPRPGRDGVPDGWRFRVLGGPGGPSPVGNPASTANPWIGAFSHLSSPIADPGMQYPDNTPATPPRLAFDNFDGNTFGWGNTANPQYGNGARQQANPGNEPAFAGDYHLGTLTLPPHSSQYVYVELFWVQPLAGLDSKANGVACVAQTRYTKNLDAVAVGQFAFENFRARVPSPNAFFRVSYRSLAEESIRGSMMLHATFTPGTWGGIGCTVPASDGSATCTANAATTGARVNPNGNDPVNARYGVLLEPGIGQPLVERVPLSQGPPESATFNFVATNIGNEYDNLKVNVDNGRNGWKHNLVVNPVAAFGLGILPSGGSLISPTSLPTCNPPGTDGACVPRLQRGVAVGTVTGCPFSDPAPGPEQNLVCNQMGVYDNVQFQASCTPPPWARVGDYDDMTITVTSDRANLVSGLNIFSRITVRCVMQGNYDYEVVTPNTDLFAYRKQTIAFPFSIHNKGLQNDRYQLVVDSHVLSSGASVNPQSDPWNPQVSAGSIVAVPAGHWYHGFLAVTVPPDAPFMDCRDPEPGQLPVTDHFRLRVQSLDATETSAQGQPALTSKVMDFMAIVCDDPVFTVSAAPVTIGSRQADAIRITANDCAPDSEDDCDSTGLTSVRFDGYYIDGGRQLPSLPRGFNFTCLPQGHPSFNAERGCFSTTEYSPWASPPIPAANWPAACDAPGSAPCASREYEVTPTFSPSREAIQQLEVSVPPDQLGISRVAHRIKATAVKGSESYVTYTDAIINMRTTFGVALEEAENWTTRIVPPGSPDDNPFLGPSGINFVVRIRNTGLTPQNVLLSNSALPPGWSIFYDQTSVALQPAGGAQYCPAGSTCIQPPGTSVADPRDCAPLALGNLPQSPVPCLTVDPLDYEDVLVGLIAPANAQPGARATVLVFGTVQEDTSKVAQLQLTAEVGQYGVSLTMTPDTYHVAPEEPARFRVSVRNSGTVTDNVDLTAQLPSSVTNTFSYRWVNPTGSTECNPDPLLSNVAVPDPKVCYVEGLSPGETRQVVLEVTTPPLVAPLASYTVDVQARSKLAPTIVGGNLQKTIKVLNYVYADIDNDGGAEGALAGLEYAVDGCTKSQEDGCAPDASDGFETFRESSCACGILSRTAPLAQFLDPDAKEALETAGRMRGESYFLDANNDGRADHFLDTDGDGLPNVLWIPDLGGDITQGSVARINFTRDVTGDQLPEIFVDIDAPRGDGRWDLVFDMAKGRFIRLLQAFVNDDAYVDYIVDANGNGRRDPGETVILGGPGGALGATLFNVDMNGDGAMDQAFDFDGDGVPEYFLDGKCDSALRLCSSLKITPQDVTGDNRVDWTYDSSGKNGKPNSYYDPNCDPERAKCSGLIDTQAQFLRDLQRYWYIGALFVVALVLFAALLMVTRRR
jgi:uncharacterized membrane protein